MSDRSGIEWTGPTWNPVTGCDRVSEGCDNCYALSLAKRLKAMGNPRYQRDGDPRTSGPGFGLTLHNDKLDEPLGIRRPNAIFVNSMSDLFHDQVPDAFVARVFETMGTASHHIFQILTKRPGRMASIVKRIQPDPLPNVWLGTSVENQKWADVRIPLLLKTPAAVRFLSCEPLLGPVDLSQYLNRIEYETDDARPTINRPALHWVIVGGESGHGFRPLDLDWARTIRDQATAAGVALFFKQVGGRTSKAGGKELDGRTWTELPASTPTAIVEELRRKSEGVDLRHSRDTESPG
jgi:protein gp37